mgnify:CR=1 FL=1
MLLSKFLEKIRIIFLPVIFFHLAKLVCTHISKPQYCELKFILKLKVYAIKLQLWIKKKEFKRFWSHHLQWKFKLLAEKFTRGNKAKHCWVISTIFFCFQKLVNNAQQCFAFTPQRNFPDHNLKFHWR